MFYTRGRRIGGSGPYKFTSNEASSFWESPKLRVIIQKSVMRHFEKVWNSVCHTSISWLSTFLFDLNDSNSTQDQGHSMKMWSAQLVLDSACQRFPLIFNPILWGKDMTSHTQHCISDLKSVTINQQLREDLNCGYVFSLKLMMLLECIKSLKIFQSAF